jgi:hypothetical protein
VCGYCNYSACSVCCKKYLTDGSLDANCMNCHRAWNDDFLDANFTRAFRTGAYKAHRENVLFEREMAILPTRQPRVEAKIKLREVGEKIAETNKALVEIEKKKQEILTIAHRHHARAARFTAESEGRPPPAWCLADGEKATPADKAKFIMKCPGAECRGFLSTAYKCGTCQLWACPDCMVMKGKDKDSPHTCNEELKATVAMIVKESKPCPKCGERISKVDGCSQMWCIECKTAFDWGTGQIVNGVIHNPHYYEYLRTQGGGVAPRNAGDVPCGGVPYYNHLLTALNRKVSKVTERRVMSIHRVTSEIADFRLAQYQGAFNMNDNGDLGVLYLLKEVSKEAMKTELAKREKKREKHMAIRAVLEMFVNTSTMMLNAIVSAPPIIEDEFTATTMVEYENLRRYVNESLMNVSRMKSCSVPQIGMDWQWLPFNKPAPKSRRPARKAADAESVESEEMDVGPAAAGAGAVAAGAVAAGAERV